MFGEGVLRSGRKGKIIRGCRGTERPGLEGPSMQILRSPRSATGVVLGRGTEPGAGFRECGE